MASDERAVSNAAFNSTQWNMPLYCEDFQMAAISTRGGVFGIDRNTLSRPVPLLTLQLGTTVLILAFIRRLLRPLKQPRFVAEILTGIIISPTLLHFFDKKDFYPSLFTGKYSSIMSALELLCFATFSFILGIRTDLSVIKTSGKLSLTIGILNFVLPLALTHTAIRFMKTPYIFGEIYNKSVSMIASSTSFQVTLVLLEDLKLLNSEIGRRAMSSALICNVCGYLFSTYRLFSTFATYFNYTPLDYLKTELPRLIMILVIIFVLRPLMFRLIKRIPEGKSISESHFIATFVLFLIVGFVCECYGYRSHFGGMVLGLAMPSGPPLGSGVVEKLEVFANSALLPAYIINAGMNVNVYMITATTYSHIEGLIVLAIFGKLAASVVPSLICRIPYQHSFTFGLILSSQGLWDVFLCLNSLRNSLISQEYYTILTIMTVINAAIVTPLIQYLYDPSKRYVNYRRRTIQHSINETILRTFLCLHEEDQSFSLMNVLKVSNPTREKPIEASVLDLVELAGRSQPILINHQLHKRPSSSKSTRTERIIRAFDQFQRQGADDSIKIQHFTTIAPYATMHDDICTLALDKNASLLMIPFHKSESLAMKGVTRNILEKAPCSVGLIVDKKIIMHRKANPQNAPKMSVGVIFIGGPDSREALAFGIRMVQSQAVKLTVIRFTAEDVFISDMTETKLDTKVLNDLRLLNEENQRIVVREVAVTDGAETIRVLLSIDEQFDYILVGRRLDKDSPLASGLSDWNYEQELGVIGDILASSDMKSNASVLVLQQQVTIEDRMRKR